MPIKYDEAMKPRDFLQLYSLVVRAVGGNDKGNKFSIYLKSNYRSWVGEPSCVFGQIVDEFMQLVRQCLPERVWVPVPGMPIDIHNLVQKPNESLRSFIIRFNPVAHTITYLSAYTIIYAFSTNMRNIRMWEKLSTRSTKIVTKLFELVGKCSCMEEG
jgi:hypothetical protein